MNLSAILRRALLRSSKVIPVGVSVKTPQHIDWSAVPTPLLARVFAARLDEIAGGKWPGVDKFPSKESGQ